MNRYEILDRLGDGAYGEVLKARSLKTNEVVAIKRLKTLFPTWEECLQLRELKSLKVLRHDNIIQLKEVIRDKAQLYFVFEYMDTSLFSWMRGHGPATNEAHVRNIMGQLFAGLAYMHKHGFFHRDIKPENCLLASDKTTLKIADLGQAREIRSRPPFTDYVSTRWYRSPELLLRASTYNSPIDLWACGCIMAELYLGKPLFAGSTEADQMCRICSILGTPTKESWPEGVSMVAHMQFKFPKCNAVPLKQLIPNASPAAIQLLVDLLQYDSGRRPTAAQALQYRFFSPVTTRAEAPREVKVPSPEKPEKPEMKRRFWEPKIDDEWKYIPQPEKAHSKREVSVPTTTTDNDEDDGIVTDTMLQDLLDEVLC
ncbi:CMGC/RCK/MAK protein kinase [Saprolegnia diclina VS20]|uniref:CMGC/RCK/MAK protein kinase n=1 Tax=Saprolegnia diclina (strain VS20) TaxID=1156394 RepID=T0RUZ2_SAPDV|nr:CMGC/RCK/MAK protein kinase [Saprolegnia diclina VS20]EQC36303.1 CMGC/RCK/MAK protein kinase [Saprolegnia diclina VS20]|eukprot:XP_008610409.1 CMGC/RCK/MAK protein kinase [Saprolegnia diclina VS20]